MKDAEYVAAKLDTEVVIETYVQVSSLGGTIRRVSTPKTTMAYYLYNMACSEEDYAKICVKGYKSTWER